MDRAVLDKVIFYFKKMLSYYDYDDIELLNKVYLVLGKKEVKNRNKLDNNKYKYFINNVTKITLDILEQVGKEDRKYFLEQLPKFIKVSLLEDSQKLKALSSLRRIEQKAIIQSFKYDDDEKINLINESEDEFFKIELIKSLESDDKKIRLLDNIESQKDRVDIIVSLQSDKKKIKLLQDITSENLKEKIVRSLQNNDKKIELLKEFSVEISKAIIIASIRDDETKIKLLKKQIKAKNNKARIIKSLQNDDKKIKFLKKISDEIDRTSIIKSLKDDNKKIKLLKKVRARTNKIDIIESIQSDDKKISILNDRMDEFVKYRIINSIQDDDKKINVLNKIESERDRSEIIKNMQVDDKKIKSLRYLNSLEFKLDVIKTLNDNAKKDYVIKNIDANLGDVYQTIAGLERGEENKNCKYSHINLPKEMTFGIEIESVGKYRLLAPRKIGEWKRETDDSIGNGGIEMVSPVMSDTKENINQIYKINEILQKMGMEANETCGGHVHIGANYIKTEEGFRQLIELWGNAEEIYYLISNKPGELPRRLVWRYAGPISKNFEKSLGRTANPDTFIEDAKKVRYDRNASLNLMNVNNKRNTIEFRLSNGTVDANTWLENIRLYGRTVEVANDLGEIVEKINSGEELTDEEKRKYALKEMLKDNKTLNEKMEILMQILFDEEERKVYQERYNSNKKLDRQEHNMDSLQFGKVDFGKVHEDIEEPEEDQR